MRNMECYSYSLQDSTEFHKHAVSNLFLFQDVFRHFFIHNFLCEKVVNLVLIFRWHEWVAVFTEYVCQFPSILHHSRKLPACHFVVLCSFVVVATAIFCTDAAVYSCRTVARERFFNRVVKTNLFQLCVWGRCKAPAGSGAEPRRQGDFHNNLWKIN